MNTAEAGDLLEHLISTWPQPAMKANEEREWIRTLLPLDEKMSYRTVKQLQIDKPGGQVRKWRPNIVEFMDTTHRLVRAIEPRDRVPHDCEAGMIVTSEVPFAARPCEHCSPEGYEAWRNGEWLSRFSGPRHDNETVEQDPAKIKLRFAMVRAALEP